MSSGPLRAGALHHVALKSLQPGKLAAFYRDVLGLAESARHVDDSGLRSVWLELGDGILMIERSDTVGPIPELFADPPGWHILALRIEADRRSAWVDKLSSAGVPLRTETAHTLYFTDPEGHRFALSHWPETAGSAHE